MAVLKQALSLKEIAALGRESSVAVLVGDDACFDVLDMIEDPFNAREAAESAENVTQEAEDENVHEPEPANMEDGLAEQLVAAEELGLEHGDVVDEITESGITLTSAACTQAQARRDWKQLMQKKGLIDYKRTVAHFNRLKVKGALQFILNPSNSVTLSWGRRKVKVGDITYDLPKITRKRTPTNMWKAYINSSIVTVFGRLSEASFLRVVNAVTHGNDRILSAVDYVTGFLINDNFKLIEAIIQHFSATEPQRKHLVKGMGISRNFMKNQYATGHASQEGDNCASHSVEYGLAIEPDTTGSRTMSCSACKYPLA